MKMTQQGLREGFPKEDVADPEGWEISKGMVECIGNAFQANEIP